MFTLVRQIHPQPKLLVMPETEAPRTLLVVDASFDLGNAIAVAALEHGWDPFLAGNAEAALSILPGLLGEVLVLVDLGSAVSRRARPGAQPPAQSTAAGRPGGGDDRRAAHSGGRPALSVRGRGRPPSAPPRGGRGARAGAPGRAPTSRGRLSAGPRGRRAGQHPRLHLHQLASGQRLPALGHPRATAGRRASRGATSSPAPRCPRASRRRRGHRRPATRSPAARSSAPR